MMKPTIHLNGTSATALREAYGEAWNKLTDALVALEECGPNGRDFYLQGPDASTKAACEHAVRISAIRAIRHEIDELRGACSWKSEVEGS